MQHSDSGRAARPRRHVTFRELIDAVSDVAGDDIRATAAVINHMIESRQVRFERLPLAVRELAST
jgi:hypothetical protein